MPLTLSQSAVRPAPLATSPKSFNMLINAATGQFSGTGLPGTRCATDLVHGLIVPSADEGIGQFVRGPQKISGDLRCADLHNLWPSAPIIRVATHDCAAAQSPSLWLSLAIQRTSFLTMPSSEEILKQFRDDASASQV